MLEEASTEPFYRSKQLWGRILLVIAGLGVLALAVAYIGYPRFKDFQLRRTMHAAEKFVQTGDYRSAYLLLDRLTQKEPGNFEVRRLFARILDTSAPDQAVAVWAALTEQEPGNAANYIGYATVALRTGRLKQVGEALTVLQKLQPSGVEYHRLAAAAALARRDSVALRDALEGLVQAEPDNVVSRFGLASLQVNSPQVADAAAARVALEEFARGDVVRIRATLVLLGDLPRRWPDKGPAQAQRLLARQLGLGVATRAGEKQYLWAQIKDQHEPDLADIIQHMQNQPGLNPEDAAMLTGWMIGQHQAREALLWLETLDAKLRSAPAVLKAMAGCALAASQWAELEKLILQGAWGEVPAEAVRYAFAARLERETGNESKSENLWKSAMRQAESSGPGLHLLARLAGHWQWPRKQEQVLGALVQQFPAEQEAWQKLAALALSAKDTAKVWRVYSAWLQADPANNQVRTSWAVLGIFVRPDEPGLGATIEEIHRLNSGNPGSQLARAMLYWRTNHWPEALALLDQIPIKSDAEPRLALARGLILASLGRATEAEAALKLVPADALLPEELALMAQARKRT